MILVVMAGLFAGCGDEERDPLPFESKVTLLAGKRNESKSWILKSAILNGSPLPMPECDKDNTYIFYNSAQQGYEISAGTQTCDSTDPEVFEEGSWAFASDGKTIIISGSKIYAYKSMTFFGLVTSKPATILELTETSFRIEINVVDGVGNEAANILVSLTAN